MKIDYYFKNVENEIIKNDIIANKDNDIISFYIDNDVFKIDTKSNILRKENNESLLILKFNKNKKEIGSYYIKELDNIFDVKIETELIENNNQYYVKYIMWLDDELIGNFELKIGYKE